MDGRTDGPWLKTSSFLTPKMKAFLSASFQIQFRSSNHGFCACKISFFKETRSRSTSDTMNIGVYSSEMPKRLQSRHSTYQSSDNLCYVCMCLFRNAQAKDAMELYIVAQAGTGRHISYYLFTVWWNSRSHWIYALEFMLYNERKSSGDLRNARFLIMVRHEV